MVGVMVGQGEREGEEKEEVVAEVMEGKGETV